MTKRKKVALTIYFAAYLFFTPLCSTANAGQPVFFTDGAEVEGGQVIYVPIRLQASEVNVCIYQVAISFDPAILRFLGVDLGPAARLPPEQSRFADLGSGIIRFVISGNPEQPMVSGVIGVVKYTLNSVPESKSSIILFDHSGSTCQDEIIHATRTQSSIRIKTHSSDPETFPNESASDGSETQPDKEKPPLLGDLRVSKPQNGIAPIEVVFEMDANGGTPPYTFDLDFGDGSDSEECIGLSCKISHTFITLGRHSPEVKVEDSHGEFIFLDSPEIEVQAPPSPVIRSAHYSIEDSRYLITVGGENFTRECRAIVNGNPYKAKLVDGEHIRVEIKRDAGDLPFTIMIVDQYGSESNSVEFPYTEPSEEGKGGNGSPPGQGEKGSP